MIITLTIDQADALDDALFEDDDALRDFPVPEIGQLGEVREGVTETDEGTLAGYAFAHPELTIEDEAVLHILLDDRVAVLDSIKALPKEERAAARAEIRKGFRQDARKAARIEARQADRKAARIELRRELRKDARVAARVAKRQAELNSEEVKEEPKFEEPEPKPKPEPEPEVKPEPEPEATVEP